MINGLGKPGQTGRFALVSSINRLWKQEQTGQFTLLSPINRLRKQKETGRFALHDRYGFEAPAAPCLSVIV